MRGRLVLVGLAGLFAVVLAACGGESGGGDAGGGETPETSDVTIAATGDPQSGGKLTYAVEAESDGWNPTVNRWAVSGTMVANAVFDPLAAYDADLEVQPYLAESFTPSADFRSWTITMRPGITFHNGEPLDGAAVKKDLDLLRASALTGGAVANIADIEVDSADPLAVVVTMIDPWATFPASLVNQAGMIAAPAQLDAEAPATSNQPIGTGPFVFKEWVPDRGWVGTKNPNYWRTDSAGNQLPYLDEVEFIPVPDNQNRANGLLTGDVQMAHTVDWTVISLLRAEAEAGNVQFVTDKGENEETFIMFNTAAAPLDDQRVRQAAALCTDRDVYFDVQTIPAEYRASSQFTPDSQWFDPDNGNLELDVAAGTALIAEVEAESGPVEFSLTTTPVPENRTATQTLRSQWEACGMTVNLSESEQSKFIIDAALGNFQANLWTQFGQPNPDADYHWWISDNANPIGELSLNFARVADPQVDAALDKGRATDDPTVRQEAYSELQRRHNELVPYIWLNHRQWAIGAQNNVRNIGNQTLPDGQESARFQVGVHRLTETWLEG
jgi:peptide/nickel transport system substrate-binding protein